MNNVTKREKIIILISVAIIMLTLGYSIWGKGESDELEVEGQELVFDDFEKDIENEQEDSSEHKDGQDEILIHITGEVKRPGIVKLKEGDRMIDAIEMAGGLTSLADQTNINLAKKLFDEDKVYIPAIGQKIDDDASSPMDITTSAQGSGVVESRSSSGDASGKININSASKEELKTLPGIGEATSQKIIDYRETTKFNTPEDIMKVSGIGEKKFEAIKEMITVR